MSAYLEPPDGRTLTGVSVRGGPEEIESFLGTTGLDSVDIVHEFSGFMNRESLSRPIERLDELQPAAGSDIGMISWRMLAADTDDSFSGVYDASLEGGTLRSVADGDIDEALVDVAGQVSEHGDPIMLRPNWEMNAAWMPWGAFEREEDGAGPREGNAPADYVDAWIRARLVFEGGTRDEIDARLQDAGLPPLEADVASVVPVDNVAWVWNPVDGAARPTSAPHDTADYYPGDDHVDWVGIDWYQRGSETVADAMTGRSNDTDPLARIDDFYREYAIERDKPIVLGEWGLSDESRGTGDDPEWMADALAWMEERPMVKAQVYFNRDAANANHRIEDFPRSAEVLREELASGRSVGGGQGATPEAGGSSDLVGPLALVAVMVLLAIIAVVRRLRGRRTPPSASV